MFIQSAPSGRPSRAIMMHDHTALSGQFARAFGNAEFEAPAPLDLVVYIISNHDAGWAEFDRNPTTDPATGLPYTVFSTPTQYILPTSKGSPDFNQRHHAYCGLLSSMHTWGIYNGRYGFSSSGRIRRTDPSERASIDAMLAHELERQNALKAELGGSDTTEKWIAKGRLFQNYKLLQFCDLLAIYYNTIHPEQRAEQTFTHVPMSTDRDVTVTIRPKTTGVYAVSPFPFAAEGTEFAFPARTLAPGRHQRDGGWSRVLATVPTEWETFRLVAG
ncbi:MAG: DUF3891 family protein [Hyphomicrobiaceae bacterium]